MLYTFRCAHSPPPPPCRCHSLPPTGVLPFAQLEVVVALTRDGGKSRASRFLRHPVIEWLGEISAALYLVHHPLTSYILWAINGRMLKWPPNAFCFFLKPRDVGLTCQRAQDAFNLAKRPPLSVVPALLLYSILAAVLITNCFEKPLQQYLRKVKNKPKTLVGERGGAEESAGLLSSA